MIKITNTGVYGWEAAIRGMRNPLNSWEKSDSGRGCLARTIRGEQENGRVFCRECPATYESHCGCLAVKGAHFVVGDNDYSLMLKLAKAGRDHAKYRRMICVTFDVVAPLYWWKEFDTYKVGTVANSCSTMHKIHTKEFDYDDFSREHLDAYGMTVLHVTVDALNLNRNKFNETKDKEYWYKMIQLLPSSYNQKRTIMLNYEVLAGMYKARKNHKLDEWHTFCDWIKTLPYSEIITGEEHE